MSQKKKRKTITLPTITPPEIRQPPTPTSSGLLLTPEELAAKLAVRPSWIREKTRERARVRDADPLPVIRLGRYVRFRWADVELWLQRRAGE